MATIMVQEIDAFLKRLQEDRSTVDIHSDLRAAYNSAIDHLEFLANQLRPSARVK